MLSGEASPIVIFENVGLGRLSLLLKAIAEYLPPSPEGMFCNNPIQDESFCFEYFNFYVASINATMRRHWRRSIVLYILYPLFLVSGGDQYL